MTYRFLVAEIPGEDLAFARLTRARPGLRVDLVSSPVPGQKAHDVWFLAHGLGSGDFEMAVHELERTYELPATIRHDGGAWLGRIRMREDAFRSKSLRALLAFQKEVGVPWMRHEGGMLHLRVRLHDRDDADALIGRATALLAAAGVDAQFAVEELARADFGPWEELVAASLNAVE